MAGATPAAQRNGPGAVMMSNPPHPLTRSEPC
jgi:hypothetical protein